MSSALLFTESQKKIDREVVKYLADQKQSAVTAAHAIAQDIVFGETDR